MVNSTGYLYQSNITFKNEIYFRYGSIEISYIWLIIILKIVFKMTVKICYPSSVLIYRKLFFVLSFFHANQLYQFLLVKIALL